MVSFPPTLKWRSALLRPVRMLSQVPHLNTRAVRDPSTHPVLRPRIPFQLARFPDSSQHRKHVAGVQRKCLAAGTRGGALRHWMNEQFRERAPALMGGGAQLQMPGIPAGTGLSLAPPHLYEHSKDFQWPQCRFPFSPNSSLPPPAPHRISYCSGDRFSANCWVLTVLIRWGVAWYSVKN